jgi:AcrR family transcriptional regulator
VSPARARTSTPEIVTAGRELLEAGGLDAVTMQAVAARVGVRAPSLYKRFPSRAALIGAIGSATADDLGRLLEPPSRDLDPAAGLRAVAAAFRSFAKAHPRAYELLFANLPPESRVAPDRNAAAAAPLLSLAERLVGPDRALEAARLITAFAHGFVSMELAGAFRLGGDVDEAFRFGVDVLINALNRLGPPPLAASATPRRRSRGDR